MNHLKILNSSQLTVLIAINVLSAHELVRTCYFKFRNILTVGWREAIVQGPAEIPDDLVTQLLVEPLA